MDYHSSLSADAKKWNRQIINFYWFSFVIAFIGQAAGLFFALRLSHEEVLAYIKINILLENALMLLLMILAELMVRYLPRLADYIVISAGILLCFAIILATGGMPGIHIILAMPLFVSVFYFDIRKLLFSGTTMLVLFLLIISFVPAQKIPPFQIILIIGTMFGLTATGITVLRRGIAIMKHLEKSLKSEQELLIQNILMDRKTKLDALTGLYNHGSFQDFLATLIEQYQKSPFPFFVALLDIDNFKKVNDTYGHWVGDIVLKKVAAIIDEKLSANDFAARYGGEEFAVI
ncbi:MAG TPA: GGDEF domain-containing protein, partial [Bacilli bacterium]